jgi:DNA modification methylase
VSALANRIVGSAEVAPDQLLANPQNWRIHPQAQQQALSAVLTEVGWVQQVIVNQRTGYVVDGHLRVALAISRAEPVIPVLYVDLSPEEEALVLASLDPLAGMAVTDAEMLAALTDGLEVSDAALAELLGLTPDTPIGDPDAVPEPPAEAVTKVGDLYGMGEHRLLCGDATSAEAMGRLLAGATPVLTVTDPPYGVGYEPEWRNEAERSGYIDQGNRGNRPSARRTGKITNDDRSDWGAAWALIPSDVLYCWHASMFGPVVQASIEDAGFDIRSQIIWSKRHFPIGRGHYHWRHECCWYAVRGASHWVGDHSQTTVWEAGLDRDVEGGHSTPKPVELIEHAVRNHDAPAVLDPFMGTGTTLIACERLGRQSYGMEIDPVYCDVIVQRWEEFTGEKAVLDG